MRNPKHIWAGILCRINRPGSLPIALILLTFLSLGPRLHAQNPSKQLIILQFEPTFNGETFHLGAKSSTALKDDQEKQDNGLEPAKPLAYQLNGQEMQFDALRFYLSNFSLLKEGKVVWMESNSYHLLDAAHPNTFRIALAVDNQILFDALKFNLGIDSTTNVSGAFGGDLDPTKGMYWAWQSGYINFKLEGKSPACPSRNNAFQYHLGGYLPPYDCVQAITLSYPAQQAAEKNRSCRKKRIERKRAATTGTDHPVIHIKFDLAELLSPLDLSNDYKVMSPGKAGKEMSIQAARLFQIHEEN